MQILLRNKTLSMEKILKKNSQKLELERFKNQCYYEKKKYFGDPKSV